MVEAQRRGRLAEYAYEYTKRMLFDGTLAPGAKVRVEDLVAQLNTSRQPVMDAFKRLAAEGYLEIIPQVGCRVVIPDPTEISDFFLIFGAVQGLTADVAAGRRTASEVRELEEIASAIAALLNSSSDDREIASAYRELNRDFHQQIRTMAHSDAVANLSAGLLDRADFYIGCIPNGRIMYAQRLRAASDEHAAIVNAIARDEGDRARTLMEAHVLAFARFSDSAQALSYA